MKTNATTQLLATFTLLGAWSSASFAIAADAAKFFDIEQQSLAAALSEFARQSDRQILFSTDVVDAKRTDGIKGKLEPEDALKKILKGTGLIFRVTADQTILVDKPGDTADLPVSPTPIRVAQAAGLEVNPDIEQIDEVVVTGTHIRGAGPVGSPLLVLDREDIQASGYGRLQDFLEAALLQSFGSVSEDRSDGTNQTQGHAINLRGVGADSTLVLVNGRRQPAGGLQGAFVDISSIAASAVQRVEVLTDGASAIYGSDAVGGVVNFVMRKDFSGFETDIRLASIDNAADELEVSQLFGHAWDGGNLLVGYQYSRRDSLMAEDRHYASMGRDYRSIGGGDLRQNFGSPGTITRAGQPSYAIPQDQDGTGLTAADLISGAVNYTDEVTGIAKLPEQTQHSAFITLTQEISDWLEVFVEGRYGLRDMELPTLRYPSSIAVPATNPFYVNPYGGTGNVTVSYNFGQDFGIATQTSESEMYTATAGAIVRLSQEWKLNFAATRGDEKNEWRWFNVPSNTRLGQCLSGLATSPCPGTPFNAFGDPGVNDARTLNYIRDILLGEGDYKISSLTAIADGPLFELPAGAVRLAVGGDYRDERLDAFRGNLAPATGVFTLASGGGLTVGKLERQVSAFFGEIVAPLWAGRGAQSSPRLELALAGRYEDYSDFGDTFNPKAGLNFSIFSNLRLRGSWGTSFRAPRFNQLSRTASPPVAIARIAAPDPRSPTGTSNFLQLGGANPDLQEETADTWTAGFDLKLGQLSAFTLSATYYDVDYKDKILAPGLGANTLTREDIWASIITRNPTQAQIDAACAELGGAPCVAPPDVAAIVDVRLRNLGGLRVRGVDLDVGYRMPLPVGSLHLGLNGARVVEYALASSPTDSYINLVNDVDRPLALRLRGTVGWDLDRWSINAAVSYADDYQDAARRREVGSWTTVDASLAYQFGTGGWLDGFSVRLSGTNILDEEPPFVNQAIGYDVANANEIGRSVGLSIEKSW